MQILVTGAHRELGRSVSDGLIRNGHRVTRVSRTPANLPKNLETIEFDLIVHADMTLGATRDRTVIDDNLFGARRLISLIGQRQTKVIALSSFVAQGPSVPEQPHISDEPTAPKGMIARSLLSAESLLWKSPLKQLTIFRLAVPYGAEGAFAQLCRSLKKTRIRPMLSDVRLSFIHVLDIVKAIELSASADKVHRFRAHLSDGVFRTGDDLLNALEDEEEVCLRIPVPTVGTVLGLAGELARPFGSWEMALHLGHGTCWTSTPAEAEETLGFAATENWRAFLQNKL